MSQKLEAKLDGDWLPVAEITDYSVNKGVRYVHLNCVDKTSHYRLDFTLDSQSVRIAS